MALVLGQHIRVGNEDNIWGADRKRATSVKQIEGVVRMAKEFGRKIATAEEARKIMKIGVWYNSVEETLKNLGLPPNPTEYNPGFLLWETDGKLKTGVVGSDSHPIAYCMVPPDLAAPKKQSSLTQALQGPASTRAGPNVVDSRSPIQRGYVWQRT